jgi:hypothetical protein
MTKVINLNSKRPPVVYRVTITHHWDRTLELFVEGVSDDGHSRESVKDALRRISGAQEEIDRLNEYCDNIDKECVKLREAVAAALASDNDWQDLALEILKEDGS